jgi:hypothetical protein
MSRHELVDAYLAGRIGRVTFIDGLIAAGMSMGAAAGYAAALRPVAAAKRRNGRRSDDFH